MTPKTAVLVHAPSTCDGCYFVQVAQVAPSNPKYRHARARLWRQTLRGGPSPGFPSSTNQPNPCVKPNSVQNVPCGKAISLIVGSWSLLYRSMSGLSMFSSYSGCWLYGCCYLLTTPAGFCTQVHLQTSARYIIQTPAGVAAAGVVYVDDSSRRELSLFV